MKKKITFNYILYFNWNKYYCDQYMIDISIEFTDS